MSLWMRPAGGAGRARPRRHGEPQELPELHRLTEESIERFATRVLEDQHRPSRSRNSSSGRAAHALSR